ncbi:outer membrane autotransporter [Nitrospirillum viridazoti Y2]|nr:outer membrane autotransporter [Nitrospirillum amazonense Y2]
MAGPNGVAVEGGTVGTLINYANATISGASAGVLVSSRASRTGVIGTISNSGVIIGSNFGIQLFAGSIGLVENSVGAGIIDTVNAGFAARQNSGVGTVDNQGLILGFAGLYADTGSTITLVNNKATGTIQGTINFGLGVGDPASAILSVSNAGTILGIGDGVQVNGVMGTLDNSGTIYGTLEGVHVAFTGSTLGTLINEAAGVIGPGSITAVSSSAVRVNAGIFVESGALAGTIINAGLVTGSLGVTGSAGTGGLVLNAGLVVDGAGVGTILNSGTIIGDTGIRFQGVSTIGYVSIAAGGAVTGGGVATISGASGTAQNGGIVATGSATIGTITNSGTISGAVGVLVQQIAAVTLLGIGAGGTITGVTSGVRLVDSGTIATLSNSGLIQAGQALLVGTAATLGTVLNSGTIAGNITDASGLGLTISGGSGSTIGTLTGATLTNQGTITNTAGNLVFAGGNLLLNDSIVATGQTVVNTGAALVLSSVVSIAGAYTQNAGTLAVIPGSSGLVVSGDASITGGTVIASLSPAGTANYLAGTVAGTLVQGGAASNYTGAAVSIAGTLSHLAGAGTTATVGGTVDLLLAYGNDYIGGSLATLKNTIAIGGVATAVYVASGGSIGTLTNTGTLSGTGIGVFVASGGTVKSLMNTIGHLISGASIGIKVSGSLGTITNNGTLLGNTAVQVAGTLTSLLNSGTITGTQAGLSISGSIGTLTNQIAGANQATGLIMANTALAISATGSIGRLVNAGTIMGKIANDGTGNLTIIGDAYPGGVSTLTGLSGSIGSIYNPNSNVVFDDVAPLGQMVLNDDITAQTVVLRSSANSPGNSLTLTNIITITGNYAQSGGALWLTPGSSQLVVSGAASITGGTIGVSLATLGNYFAGSLAGTLVDGGAGSNYGGLALGTSNLGVPLSITTATVGGHVDLVAYYAGDLIATTLGNLTVTGSGESVAINYFGTLGTLVNTGTIKGAGIALGIGTAILETTGNTLGTFVNHGLVTVTHYSLSPDDMAIYDDGAIGTLINAVDGTIQGHTALYITTDTAVPVGAAYRFGGLANSGLIQGNIYNYSTGSPLTIAGGAAGTIGTLTGTVGQATIAAYGSSVVFSTGNLLLDDTVMARTITNVGASLMVVNPVTLTGVSGTAATVLMGAASTLAVGPGSKLVVSGTASIAGTVKGLSTGNYTVSTNTLVTASGGADYSTAVLGTITGLAATLGTVGNALLMTIGNDYIGGNLGSLTNTGSIGGVAYAAVIAAAGSVGTLSNSGTLSGNTRGIYLIAGAQVGTITNQGHIVAVGGAGAAGGIANDGGTIATIVNTGTIASSASSGIGNNRNSASIGQITNSGLISGFTGGIYSQGTIGTITNSGRIVGTQVGISINGGAVGTINNSGTVTGATALLVASGATLGPVTNSGLIAGQILNASANVLTISGGTGASTGTLTGQTVTNKGSIVNTLSNLVFAGGNLLLNDNINITGHTVTNSGASLTLSTIVSITGAYTQGSSGTLSLGQSGELVASGGATVAGTVLTGLSTAANYTVSSRTLVAGGSGANYSSVFLGDTVATGLAASVTRAGNNLLLTIRNDYIGGTLASLGNSGSIGGVQTALAIATSGSVGTVSNSGTLRGNTAAISNLGTIGTLTNSASGLVGGVTGVANTVGASIGTLVNAGSISAQVGVYNFGTIGALLNNGIMYGSTGGAVLTRG